MKKMAYSAFIRTALSMALFGIGAGFSSFSIAEGDDFKKIPPITEPIQIKSAYRILIKLKDTPSTANGAGLTAEEEGVFDELIKEFNVKSITSLLEKVSNEQSSENTALTEQESVNVVLPELSKVHVVELPKGTDMDAAVAAFAANEAVAYAEADGAVQASATYPNDSYFRYGYQWGLHNTGRSGGHVDADIDAPEGWDSSTGASRNIIAVLDTGVNYNHTDLKGKVTFGYDFVNNDFDAMDDHYHGTHVAGIAAANTNNNTGIAGVCWACKVMPVKVLDRYGGGYWTWLAQGIAFATVNNADVINMSLRGSSYSQVVRDAVKDAYKAGVILVASAGNYGREFIGYPARYPEVIAVGATDRRDSRAYFSSYGSYLDLVAPGVDILSTYKTYYAYLNGTSMASPHVAGAVGALLAINSDTDPDRVRTCLRNTTDDLGSPGWDKYYGAGRLNLDSLLKYCGDICQGKQCTIKGTTGSDNLSGTNGDDVICGRDGNDIIYGRGGNDTICGGNGSDRLYGEAGDDILIGGANSDQIYGGDGEDMIEGGKGADLIFGGNDSDEIYGMAGSDYIKGQDGDDVISGGTGNDNLLGNDGKDVINGDQGNDRIEGGAGNDMLYGGNNDDELYGGAGNDTLSGAADHDQLYGSTGDDVLFGGSGRDVLKGQAGEDVLEAGNGNDQLYGNANSDILLGGKGLKDYLNGGPDQDLCADPDTPPPYKNCP